MTRVDAHDDSRSPRRCARIAGCRRRPRRLAPAPARHEPHRRRAVFRTGTTAVLLDIVVRDKRGRPIRDLRQDEITVLEDGAPREVKSFRLVEGAARRWRPVHARLGRRPAGSAAPGHARLPGLRPPRPERPQAGAEGGAGLSEEAAPDRAVGGGVLARQPAAHAAGLLAQCRRAVRGGRSRDGDRRARKTPRRCRGRAGSRPDPSSTGSRAAGAAVNPATAGADAVAQQMREMTERMQTLATSIETSQRGHATFYPLMALAKAQGAPRRPQGDPALLGGPAGAQRGRGDLPGDDQRSQPRQRERLRHRRPRARYQPRPGRRRRGARQGRPRQPAGDGQARRRRHVDGRSAERRPRALDASSPARSRCCASWPRTPAAR